MILTQPRQPPRHIDRGAAHRADLELSSGMYELLNDVACATLLAALAAFLGPRLMPRLKRLSAWAIFLPVLLVVGCIGIFVTPAGGPLYDAVAMIVGLFVALAGVLLIGAARGTVPSVTHADWQAPTADERRWVALGVVFSYVWFVLLFLAIFGLRWSAY